MIPGTRDKVLKLAEICIQRTAPSILVPFEGPEYLKYSIDRKQGEYMYIPPRNINLYRHNMIVLNYLTLLVNECMGL